MEALFIPCLKVTLKLSIRLFDMLRYLVYDNGILIRKFVSRIECEIYIRSGCTLTVLPKPKNPTHSQVFTGAFETLGGAPF